MSYPNPDDGLSLRQNNPACQLPPKIVKIIVDQVPNSTIKNLRLTSRYYSETAALRLNRVFISANPRNVEVFAAIANHEVFRAQITEIIWDDALLYVRPEPHNEVEGDYGSDDDYEGCEDEDECDEDGIDWRGDVPGWFRKACRQNIFDMKWCRDEDVDRPSLVAREQQMSEQMPMEEAWAYYQELLQQQRDALDLKVHINALEKHLGSFPGLQRITITAATHGRLYNPLYETPMIRAFPRGFNHYIPRGWPIIRTCVPECNDWNEDGSDWQGFRVVTRLLAEDRDYGRVTDLRIDANELEMGLNSRVFEKENRILNDFQATLARPNFTHLHLDLMVDPHYRQADVFRSGLLKRALASASAGQGLKYLSLRTNMDIYRTSERCNWYVPLTTIFTPTSYSRLEHFGLARFYVKQDDLLALLASLPKTLRSVELSNIPFISDGDSYRMLLYGVRDTLGWKGRDPRPILTVSTDIQNPLPGRAIWVEDELYRFLYQDGSNPFKDSPVKNSRTQIKEGFGWEKDSFDPDHKRPHVDDYDLADMGYIKDMGPRPVPRPRPQPL